ncbi:MAG: hypothetical protein NTZ78_09190 [Candidatus Aureabacteria bacterium]|nr:hypothetical protein [Candidatus Auribacterota bacterium]
MKTVIAFAAAAAVLLCVAPQAPAQGTVSKDAGSGASIAKENPSGAKESGAVQVESSAPSRLSAIAGPRFIGNKGSRKVHRASCEWGQKISPGKRIYFNSYEEAKAAGYIPCRTCKPDQPASSSPARR